MSTKQVLARAQVWEGNQERNVTIQVSLEVLRQKTTDGTHGLESFVGPPD